MSPYATIVRARLTGTGIELVTSDLTRMECRVKPIRNNDSNLLTDFDEFFDATMSEILPLSRAVIDLATEIRAQSGAGTPDAIHVAAARIAACDVFLTNDHRLDRLLGIAI